jgi:hypothetical protein
VHEQRPGPSDRVWYHQPQWLASPPALQPSSPPACQPLNVSNQSALRVTLAIPRVTLPLPSTALHYRPLPPAVSSPSTWRVKSTSTHSPARRDLRCPWIALSLAPGPPFFFLHPAMHSWLGRSSSLTCCPFVSQRPCPSLPRQALDNPRGSMDPCPSLHPLLMQHSMALAGLMHPASTGGASWYFVVDTSVTGAALCRSECRASTNHLPR